MGDGSNPSRDNLLLHEDEYSEASDDDSETEMNKKDTWNSHVIIKNVFLLCFLLLHIIFISNNFKYYAVIDMH